MKDETMKYMDYRKAWEQAGNGELLTSFPLHLDIDITDNCNKRCSVCIQWRNPGFTNQLMPLEMFQRILTEAEKEGCCSINIGANTEPLYHEKQFLDIMSIYQKHHFLDSFVHTNGLRLTKKAMQAILDAGIRNLIFSFAVLENPRHNDLEIENLLYAYETRVEQGKQYPLILIDVMPHGGNQEELKRLLENTRGAVDRVNLQDIMNVNDNIGMYPGMKPVVWRCMDSWRRMRIDAYGEMFQCCTFPALCQHLRLGDVKDMSVKKAWFGPRAMLNRNRLRDDPVDECIACMRTMYHYDG